MQEIKKNTTSNNTKSSEKKSPYEYLINARKENSAEKKSSSRF